MEFLGVGPLELIFILIIALIVLGPDDMVKAGRTIGRFLRQLLLSPGYRTVREAWPKIKYLPNQLMREAGIEEIEADLKNVEEQVKEDLTSLQKEIQESLPDKEDLTITLPTQAATTPRSSSLIFGDISDWTTPPAGSESSTTSSPTTSADEHPDKS